MKQISNVSVSFNTDETYSINWSFDGARYHIWPNGAYGRNNATTLFKRPPHGIKSNELGYFHSRRLDGTKPGNAKMIASVMEIVNAGNMIEVARAAHQTEQDRANRDSAETARLLQEAKIVLFDIADRLSKPATNPIGHRYSLDTEQMRALIAYRDHHE